MYTLLGGGEDIQWGDDVRRRIVIEKESEIRSEKEKRSRIKKEEGKRLGSRERNGREETCNCWQNVGFLGGNDDPFFLDSNEKWMILWCSQKWRETTHIARRIASSHVFRRLLLLRNAGLIRKVRDGKWGYCSLGDRSRPLFIVSLRRNWDVSSGDWEGKSDETGKIMKLPPICRVDQ